MLVTGSLPVVHVEVGQLSVIEILAADWDSDQVVRCRWSFQTPLDECGDVCLGQPNASLSAQDCTVTWRAVLRAEDIANGLTTSTYAIAITAEDFENASSTTPLSSTPHQMLVQVYTKPSGWCGRPTIASAPRRNGACYGENRFEYCL